MTFQKPGALSRPWLTEGSGLALGRGSQTTAAPELEGRHRPCRRLKTESSAALCRGWSFPPHGNDAAIQSKAQFLFWAFEVRCFGGSGPDSLQPRRGVLSNDARCRGTSAHRHRALWKHLYLMAFRAREVGSSCLNLAVACGGGCREDTAHAFMLEKLFLLHPKCAFIEHNSRKLIGSRSGPLKTWPLCPRGGLEQKMPRYSAWLALISHAECGESVDVGLKGSRHLPAPKRGTRARQHVCVGERGLPRNPAL